MTLLDERPTVAPLPDWFTAAMNTALDEPLHGDLVPLTPVNVKPGDFVLSTLDLWLRVDEAPRSGAVRTVVGAVLDGDQVWRWKAADVLAFVALGDAAGGPDE